MLFSADTDIVPLLDQLHPLISASDLSSYASLFKQDLLAALHNQNSSLPAILNPISRMKPVAGSGVAVSLGGTNGYVSAFKISSAGKIAFINRLFFSLPPKTSKNDLFQLISEHIFSSVGGKKAIPIGIGFAYPLKPLLHHGFIDGRLLHMAKGRNIKGLVGEQIGKEYHSFLKERYGIDSTVAVANDAVCLLLGGEGTDMAGVIGTGLNFAYWEKRSAIAPIKLGELSGFGDRDVAVNIESRNFDKVKGSLLRDRVDRESSDKGTSLAEKEVAGAYLYQLFNAGIHDIVGSGFPVLNSTDQLNDILTGAYQYSAAVDEPMRIRAKIFTERLFHRSAQIAAVELCGILMKLKKEKGIVPVVMEGGLFWKAKNYSTLVNLYIHSILPDVIPSFARLFGSSRKGIALLAINGIPGV